MTEELRKSISKWHRSYGSFHKLQHAYIVLAAAIILVAGIASLFNYTLGQQILALAFLVLIVFLVNLVAWSLLSELVLRPSERADAEKRTTRRTTKR